MDDTRPPPSPKPASGQWEVEQDRTVAAMLRDFSDELASQQSTEAVRDAVLRRLVDTVHADAGALYLTDRSTRTYSLAAHCGIDEEGVRPTVDADQHLVGVAIASRTTVHVERGEDPLGMASRDVGSPGGPELYLPLVHGGDTIGVVCLRRDSARPFEEFEISLLETLARQASSACAIAQALSDVEQTAADLQAVLAATDEGIYTIDRHGRITMVNPAVSNLTGYLPEEMVGRNAHRLLHHSHADGSPYPPSDCPIRDAIREGRSLRVQDEVFWRKDGTSFAVEYGSYPLVRSNALEGAVITFLDITRRKRVEHQLDAQYEVARVLTEATGLEEDLPRVLATLCQSLGWRIGIGWIAADHGRRLRQGSLYAEPGWEAAARALSSTSLPLDEGPGGRAFSSGRLRFEHDLVRHPPRRNFDNRWNLQGAVGVPLATMGGELLGVAEFFCDFDMREGGLETTLSSIASQVAQYVDRKRSEDATDRMRQEFVATVSHELRTPLTAIYGWTKLLLSGDVGPFSDEQREALLTVERNSNRLMRLVGDLLVAGQIQTGRLDLELAPVDIAAVAREAAAQLSPAAEAKRLSLEVDANVPVKVMGDQERLMQLVGNLLSNAIKYTPSGGGMGIRVGEHGSVCRIEVWDTGIGIPQKERQHLFERFFRASTAIEQSIVGTGLGLAISRAIAEAHHGSIGIADQDEPGSLFFVELPMDTAGGLRGTAFSR